ncbi:rab-GTPase-TBC domain-containing protein, partial [Gorgonomyces haynaldii]
SMATTPWFLSLYCTVLPIQTCLRVWDLLFYQGEKVLFRVALSLLGQMESRLVQQTDVSEAWTLIK